MRVFNAALFVFFLMPNTVFSGVMDENLLKDLRSSIENLKELKIKPVAIDRDDLKTGIGLTFKLSRINEEKFKDKISQFSFLTLRTNFFFINFLESINRQSIGQERKDKLNAILKEVFQGKAYQFVSEKINNFTAKEETKLLFKIEKKNIFYSFYNPVEDIILIKEKSSCKDNNCLLYSIIGDNLDLLSKIIIDSGVAKEHAQLLASNIMKVPERDEAGLEKRDFSLIRKLFIERIEKEISDKNSVLKNKIENILDAIFLNTNEIKNNTGENEKNRAALLAYLQSRDSNREMPSLDGLFAVIFSLLYNYPVYLMSGSEQILYHANDFYKNDIIEANKSLKKPIYIYSNGKPSNNYGKFFTVDSYIEKLENIMGMHFLSHIKTKIYTDKNSQYVAYNHENQRAQLLTLKHEGKNLNLILGRGNNEISSKIPLGDAANIWVYGNIDGAGLLADSTPHLWMDFNKISHLRTLPDKLFNIIAFDNSVIKFFDMPKVSAEFYRLLKPGGKFFYDLSLSFISLCLPPDTLEKCAQSPTEKERIFQTQSGFRYLILDNWGIRREQRHAFQEPSSKDRAEMYDKREEFIKNHLENIFGSKQCVLKEQSNPIPENSSRHFECTRRLE